MEGAVVLQVGAAALMGAQAVHDWLKSSFTAGLFGDPAAKMAQALSSLAGAAST